MKFGKLRSKIDVKTQIMLTVNDEVADFESVDKVDESYDKLEVIDNGISINETSISIALIGKKKKDKKKKKAGDELLDMAKSISKSLDGADEDFAADNKDHHKKN